MSLKGRHILLGITAGIAAYKTCELVRMFQKLGADVKVVMTENAKEFVSPLSLSALSKNKVYCEQFTYTDYDIEHVELAKWADIFVIAPATANTISKIANGICDNLLTTTVCAINKPVILAPAMNVHMWENSVFQENLKRLKDLKFYIIEPEEGFLACGDNAKGRMAESDKITQQTEEIINKNKKNKTVIITAGGTKENIDPVRYIGNYSSGKMGIAIANEAFHLGYDVILISTVNVKNAPFEVINVQTAQEMLNEVKDKFINANCLIMVAAVADYRPAEIASQKIKKENQEEISIKLIKNPDILKEIGKNKKENQKIIGFCAESENLLGNATKKIKDKNLDYIIANDISRSDIGFGSEYNEVTILSKNGNEKKVTKATKSEIAREILKYCDI